MHDDAIIEVAFTIFQHSWSKMDFSDQYGSFPKASIGEAMELDLSEEDITQRKRASVDWRIKLPEIPTSTTSRFKKMSDSDISQLEESNQSQATKNNTKWGVRLFQGKLILKLFYLIFV